MPRVVTVWLTVVVSSLAASPMAQAPERQDARRGWRAWLDAVETHVPGQRDAAVDRVAPWLPDALEALLLPLSDMAPADLLRTVERAIVLHVDVAILHRAADGYSLPAGSHTATILADGQSVGTMNGTVHWDFTRRLLDRVTDRDSRLGVGRLYYRATAAVLQLWGEYPELTTQLSAGRRVLGDDAVLLMFEGTMHQGYAGPRMQRYFDERRRAQKPGANTVTTAAGSTATSDPRRLTSLPAFPTVSGSHTQAERLFRRALAVDPTLTEARIRLATVLGDSGRHDEAATELTRVLAVPLSPLLDYYASLVTGREARALGRLDAALAAFERAAAIHPRAQAPQFGLSELSVARGDHVDGLARLVDGAAAEGADVDEPWWWFDRAHDPSAETLMKELHRTVRP